MCSIINKFNRALTYYIGLFYEHNIHINSKTCSAFQELTVNSIICNVNLTYLYELITVLNKLNCFFTTNCCF